MRGITISILLKAFDNFIDYRKQQLIYWSTCFVLCALAITLNCWKQTMNGTHYNGILIMFVFIILSLISMIGEAVDLQKLVYGRTVFSDYNKEANIVFDELKDKPRETKALKLLANEQMSLENRRMWYK